LTRDVLSPENAGVLQEFADLNVLAAFDYDGTLAPIAPTPDRAHMRESTRESFRRLSDAFPTVVISGREQADVDTHLDGFGLFAVIGNHGMEPWEVRESYRRQAGKWMVALGDALHDVPGVWLEDKRFSVAAHYRGAPDPAAARRAIMGAVAALPDVRIVGGKRVVNVLPAAAPNKGMALEMARVSLACDAAIYVGDDDTDEDVFGLRPDWPLLTVRVGCRQTSKAQFCLRGQHHIDDLLDSLAALRLRPDRALRQA
jgi:trehalose 6-phosphate phosphatase